MKFKFALIAAIALTIFSDQNVFAQNVMNRGKDHNRYSMFQKLNLTDEQKEQISTLRLNHQMEMIDLKASAQKKKLELAELKNKGSYSRQEYISKIEAINSAKDQLAIARANFQMNIYESLDTNQKKEWNKSTMNFYERNEKRKIRKNRDCRFN